VNSIILTTCTRALMPVILAMAVFILLRGHNEPGGGFIGGLLAAVAFALIEKSQGVEAARKALRFQPLSIAASGLACSAVSGLWGGLVEGAFLKGVWPFYGPLPEGGTGGWPVGSILLFDLGVCLVVLGGITGILFALEEAIEDEVENTATDGGEG